MRKLIIFPLLFFSFLIQGQSQADSLHEYTGKYVFPDGSVVPNVEVTLADSVLMMNSAAGSSIIVKEEKDRFTIVEFGGWAEFKRNDTGKVNAVHIEAGGYVLDGTKQEDNGWSFTVYRLPACPASR